MSAEPASRIPDWVRWLLAGALLVAAVAGGVAVERRALVERLLLWQLRERGVEPASLVVERAGPAGLALREIRLGRGDLELRSLVLHCSLACLAQRRLEGLELEGLRLRGVLRESGLSFGSLDALWAGGGESPGPGFPVLPTARLEVTDASLELETERGPAGASLEVELDAEGRGHFALEVGQLEALDTALGVDLEPLALRGTLLLQPDRLELDLEPAAFTLALASEDLVRRIAGVTPALRLRGDTPDSFDLEASGGELSLAEPAVAARGFALQARLGEPDEPVRGELRIAELLDLRPEPMLPPLAFEARFAPEGEGLAFSGALRGQAERLVVEFEGMHDLATGTGRTNLRLQPLHFEEGGPQPPELFPVLTGLVPSASGSVEARGELSWTDAGTAGFVDFGLRDLTLDTGAGLFERVNAAVRVEGPWPLRIPPGQLVSMARVDFGLELTDGLVRYEVDPDGVVALESARWSFAGGSVTTTGSLDLFAAERSVLLTVDEVDLGQLLELVDLDGLSGTGRIGGQLPVVLRAGGLEIRDGVLEASPDGGWIRYRPTSGAAGLGTAEPAMGDLLEALRDFRYEHLSLRVDGAAEGEVVLAVSLAGANPEHRDAQPYEFNLNLEGRLGDLVRKGTASYEIPTRIEERLGELVQERP